MGAITIKTNNKEHFSFLKIFLESLRWDLGIEYDDSHSKEETLEEFWQKIRNHKSVPAPINVEELKIEILKATEELKKGNGIKHEDVMKEIKTWI